MAYYFDDLIVSELRTNKNDTAALRELYRSHYPMILNLVCTNSGTEQEAKDIFQEAVIAFYEKLQHADFVLTCKIKTYLYAVCRRLWLKRLSEKKRFTVGIAETETFKGIEEEMTIIEENEMKFKFMSSSLGALGEPCKSIIEDFYVNDLSMEAIRDKFGYNSTESAKNQKYKCLLRLKKIFFTNYNNPS